MYKRQGELLEDYVVESGVLNSADFGSPQARRRAIIVGSRRDVIQALLPRPTHGREEWVPASAVFDRTEPRVSTTELDEMRWTHFRGRQIPGAYSTRELHITRQYQQLSLDRFKAIPPGGNRFNLPVELQARCWVEHKRGATDVMGRMHLDRPSVTVRTEFFKPEKGRYIHPTEHRAITHREAALLQGFPDHYGWLGTKNEIARQIGNAVPVPLGAAIGRSLVHALEGRQPMLPVGALF